MTTRLCRILSGLLFSGALIGQAASFDGPYVMPAPTGGWETWTVAAGDAGLVKRVKPIKGGDTITIEAAENRPAFQVTLRGPAAGEPERTPTFPGRAFLMADSHGQYEVCTELLMKQGIVDSGLRWSFGTGRLVVLGDILDRGPRHLEILWLLYKLEAEAEAAGGRVHVILGNHEVMSMTGDNRYLNARYIQSMGLLGVNSYADLLRKDGLLGQWLRTKPTVFELAGTLCLHGGISLEAVDQKISVTELNQAVRDWLNDERSHDSGRLAFVTGQNGPLWYRGLVKKHAKPEDVEAIKKFYGVEHIAVGHTIVPTVTALYNGSVIAVQVYPTKDAATGKMNMEGVYIDEQGTWHKAKIDGTREILRDDAGNPIRNGVPAPATGSSASASPSPNGQSEPTAEEKPVAKKAA